MQVGQSAPAETEGSPEITIDLRFTERGRGRAVAVVDVLLEAGVDGVGDTLCVVPGGRARRTVLRELLERPEAASGAPPQLLTPGELLNAAGSAAGWPGAPSTLERRLAWLGVLTEATGDDRALLGLVGDPPIEARWAVALRLDRLVAELATAGRRPADAESATDEFGRASDAAAWAGIARIEAAWRIRLRGAGYGDPDGLALLDPVDIDAVAPGAPARPKRIVLAGLAELTTVQRRAIARLAAAPPGVVAGGSVPVIAISPVDQEHADGVDAFGCPVPSAWLDRPVAPGDADLLVAADADDHAVLTARALAEVVDGGGDVAVDEVAVAALEPDLLPGVRAALRGRGVLSRSAAGRRVRTTEAAALLRSLAAWADRGAAEAFASLARAPRIEAWFRHRATNTGASGAVDLPSAVDHWWRSRLSRTSESHSKHPIVGDLVAALETLTERLAGPAAPLPAWGPAIGHLLADLNTDRDAADAEPSRGDDTEDWLQLAAAADRLAAVPAAEAARVTGLEALHLVLELAGEAAVAEPPDRSAVDILGWLEVAFDDAPRLVITGVHDGSLPGRAGADPLLPDRLRTRLGLADDAARLGRDIAILHSVLRGRERVRVVAARRAQDGTPYVPSRVLLNVAEADLPARLARLVQGGDAPAGRPAATPGPGPEAPAASTSAADALEAAFDVPELVDAPPVLAMRVTDFKRWLECPYRFALERRYRLEPRRPDPVELDALAFGMLAHAVLERFGADEAIRRSSSPKAIREHLDASLAKAVEARHGSRPRAAVRLQVARLRQRLGAFAEVQAALRDDGWVIAAVEWSFPVDAAIPVPGGDPMRLTGRIDRIDIHETRGDWRIIDYKSGERATDPMPAHHSVPKTGSLPDDPAWTDLQLPLYRHVLAGQLVSKDWPEVGGAIEAGYITLPKTGVDVVWRGSDWTDDHVASAVERAGEIAAAVRSEPVPAPVSIAPDRDRHAWICRSHAVLFPGDEESGEGDGEGPGHGPGGGGS